MINYPKTDGYKWTNGDGKYYTELYAPDDAPAYTLVSEAEMPEPEPTADELLDILFGGEDE